MAVHYCRRVSTSLAVLNGVALLFFSGVATADYTPQQINKECSACDTSVLAAINTYQSDFGKWSKAVDGAKYHCARFAKLRSCYTDCLHDTIYTYSSSMKSIFDQFYSGICDPVCYLAVLPYCYTSTVGTYDITKSCSGTNMNPDLKRCVQTELFIKQNCTGVCTQGQRKAMFYFFSTMFQCTIPYQTANDCFTWTLYCSEAIFSYNGAAYVSYVNQSMIASNRLGCSAYGDAYRECVEQAIDGDVILGTPPYTVTYNSPCADLTAELRFLTDFDYTMLVGPFCDNPDQSFNDTCQAYGAPTTTTTTTTTTQRPSTATAATRAEPPAASTIITRAPPTVTVSPTPSASAPADIEAQAGLSAAAAGPTTRQTAAAQPSPSSTTAAAPGPLSTAGGAASDGQPTSVTLAQANGPASSTVSKPASTKRFVPSTKAPHRLITTLSDSAVAVSSRAALAMLACAVAGLWAHFGFN